MGIGVSIFILALGAIIAFAVTWDSSVINLDVVGWVLMLAGVLGLVLTMWYWPARRRASESSVIEDRYYAADPHVPPAPDPE